MNLNDLKNVESIRGYGFLGGIDIQMREKPGKAGFQVYKEVCAGCHGVRLISYRNLAALGYNQDELKAIASQFEITDGPNDDGEFFRLFGISVSVWW
mgnify:CR=1 FL=1